MTPIEIACRHVCRGGNAHCGAEGGELCDWSKCIGVQVGFHAERILDAATMTRVADPVNAAAFDQAAGRRLFDGMRPNPEDLR